MAVKRKLRSRRAAVLAKAIVADEKAHARAQKSEEVARLRLVKRKKTYALARPLTLAEREALARHVEEGQPLCCDAGLEFLRKRLPEPWAQAINEWAYFGLGCLSPDGYRKDYAGKVRSLKLDQFPN